MTSVRQRLKERQAEQRTQSHAKVTRFYRSCPWDRWWDEFIGTRGADGLLLHKTAWAFAKIKARDKWELQVIYWCIGPRPKQLNERRPLPVKWLGDWQQQRAKQFYYGDEKIQALQRVIAERETALDAARGVANVALDWIAKAQTWSQQADELFHHLAVVPGLNEKENTRRFNHFMETQERILRFQMRALREYLHCHGVGEDDVTMLAQMAAVGAQAALKGVQAGAQIPQHPVLNLIVDTLVKKAETYQLDLPEADKVIEAPPVAAEESKDGK